MKSIKSTLNHVLAKHPESGGALIFAMIAGTFLSVSALYISALSQNSFLEALNAVRVGEVKDIQGYIKNSLNCNKTLALHAANAAKRSYLYGENETPIMQPDPGNASYMIFQRWNIRIESYDSATKIFQLQIKHKSKQNWKSIFRDEPLQC